MESLNERVHAFLEVGSGNGSGDGSGYGDGYGDGDGDGSGNGSENGSGYGSGNGSGYGSGNGDGYGDGYGYGFGGYDGDYDDSDGIAEINGSTVYSVDGVPTVFTAVIGDAARGMILNSDLTETVCYIVKGHGYFAHGETLVKAVKALQDKIFQNMDADGKITEMLKALDPSEKYPASVWYDWHHKLTGSCEAGRNAWLRNHEVSMDDMYTMKEFAELTQNDYGGRIIKQLLERLEEEK